MMRIIKGAPLPIEVRAQVDAHPLGTAAHLLRAVGLAVCVGGLFAMVASILTGAPVSSHQPVPDAVVIVAAAIGLTGAVLIHQGTTLYQRVVTTKLHTTVSSSH
ncbi:hypothetical protein ACJH6J_30475 [Mycobacterium sp. SMC-18]|uniref:hypothetical protein n=1 Tax=Mycobacterium sp. SMC-18 TaxID=3381629 RepID=UPI0038765E4F